MTRVDFYIAAESDWENCLKVACRVTEKAWRRQHDVYVHTPSESIMAAFDDLLWSFRSNSFVPHRLEQDKPVAANGTPEIVIGCSGNPGQQHDILINLSDDTPEFFGRFNRIAEIVRGDEQAKARSRERYKYYRKRGYPLDVHHL